MAELVGNHCWATPKCGITTAERHFKSLKTGVDFQFVVVRNPYRRIVSFYINKVVKHGTNYGMEGTIPHINDGTLYDTFAQMIGFIRNSNIMGMHKDRHLGCQSVNVTEHRLHFVRCEHWEEDIRVVCERLNLDHSKYGYVHENRSVTTDDITEYVGNRSPNWFRDNGFPSNYGLFYNDSLRARIRELYKKDFDWLSPVYEDLEII